MGVGDADSGILHSPKMSSSAYSRRLSVGSAQVKQVYCVESKHVSHVSWHVTAPARESSDAERATT